MSTTAFIALGSNLGDRRSYLDRAIVALAGLPGTMLARASRYHETAPVGGPAGQGAYLNAVVEVDTTLTPEELLNHQLRIEQSLGRVRLERDGPRTIDLDLLLYGNETRNTPELILPHPRLQERTFVLAPLAEIAPLTVHPTLQTTLRELLDRLPTAAPMAPGRELAHRRAVVTGSTSGIGRAIALELAAAGADVLVHGRRSEAAALAVVDQLRGYGVQSRAILADLREPAQAADLVDSCWREFGKIDIWINNAGADTLTGEAARWPFERKLAELLAVDVTATMTLSRAAGAQMQQLGDGCIVNVGWDQADTGMEGDSGQLFGATKAAVMAFSKSLALTLAPQVRVNCLAPGWIRTAWGATAATPWQERVRRETPMQRWGLPQDIASTTRWLVGPGAAYITGQVIRVNGGAVR